MVVTGLSVCLKPLVQWSARLSQPMRARCVCVPDGFVLFHKLFIINREPVPCPEVRRTPLQVGLP